MNRATKTERALGAILMLGASLGLLSYALDASAFGEARTAAVAALMAFAYLFAAHAGWRLWQGNSFGRKWAPWLFAAQVPLLSLPGFEYGWYAGINAGLKFFWSAGTHSYTILASAGAGGGALWTSQFDGYAIGFNAFAACAALALLRPIKSFKPRLLRGST